GGFRHHPDTRSSAPTPERQFKFTGKLEKLTLTIDRTEARSGGHQEVGCRKERAGRSRGRVDVPFVFPVTVDLPNGTGHHMPVGCAPLADRLICVVKQGIRLLLASVALTGFDSASENGSQAVSWRLDKIASHDCAETGKLGIQEIRHYRCV